MKYEIREYSIHYHVAIPVGLPDEFIQDAMDGTPHIHRCGTTYGLPIEIGGTHPLLTLQEGTDD